MKSDSNAAGKRIVLTTYGSFGDLHPYIALALELKTRGHSPVIATSPIYREKIEAEDIGFHSVRPDMLPPEESAGLIARVLDGMKGAEYLYKEIIMPALRDGYADLSEVVREADLLVSHPLTYAAPLLAQKTNIPWVSTVLAPVSFFSTTDPPVPFNMPGLYPLLKLSPIITRVALMLGKRSVASWVQPVRKLRAELGLLHGAHPMFEGQHSPQLVLALFSKVLAEPQADWPPQARVTGFAFYDRKDTGAGLSPELLRFLDAGAPPVVFTLGSSAYWDARDFFHQSIAAARELKQRAVLLIGDARNLPEDALPQDVVAFDYAPYSELLPRACVVVHQGGIGTTGQALRAGKPTLIMPFSFDQPDNAARVERLGASRTITRRDYKSARVAKELNALLFDPGYAKRAREVSLQMQSENGASAACDALEALLSGTATKQSRGENSFMLLVIDAGNTHIKLGLYDADKLVERWRLVTAQSGTADEYAVQVRGLLALAGIDAKEINAVAIACVVLPLHQTLRETAKRLFHVAPLFVDHTIEIGLEILYDAPQDVGADRLVNAAAAVHKYGAPCIVVDFGTATKFEAINEQRQYLGGVIAPGLGISMEALFARAPRLPRVEIKKPQTVIGSSTVAALQSGLYYGYASLIDGILAKMRGELNEDARVVATGGLAHLIAAESKLIETIDDTLTLDGLRFIYERSQTKAAK